MERHLQCYTYQLHSKQAELWKSKNCLRFGKGYYWTKTTQYRGDKPKRSGGTGYTNSPVNFISNKNVRIFIVCFF